MGWRVICDRCGFKYWNHELRKEWTGLMVCHGGDTNDCWEARHPQDFVTGVKDKQTPPWVRPEAADVFVLDYYRREDGTIIYRENGLPLLRE